MCSHNTATQYILDILIIALSVPAKWECSELPCMG